MIATYVAAHDIPEGGLVAINKAGLAEWAGRPWWPACRAMSPCSAPAKTREEAEEACKVCEDWYWHGRGDGRCPYLQSAGGNNANRQAHREPPRQ